MYIINMRKTHNVMYSWACAFSCSANVGKQDECIQNESRKYGCLSPFLVYDFSLVTKGDEC